ncbi:MAG: oligosaccharide flippase family protein [candidate division WOR-3 bacterium]|nr:oligosaccharide flippase family protein [candidate division WOR-3 bacterium]
MQTIATVILLAFGAKIYVVMTFYVFSQGIGVMIMGIYNFKLLPYLKYSIAFDYMTFKEIFNFSIFTAINSITGNIVFRVDKMIVSYFLGSASVTYYQVVFMMAQYAFGFITYIIQFLFPYVSYISSIGEKEKLWRMYKKAILYASISSFGILVILITAGNLFLEIWIGKGFSQNTGYLIYILSTVFYFITVSNVGYYFYNGLGKSHINMISSFVGASSYLIASYLLIPKLGINGAGFAFVFVLIPMPFYLYYIVKLLRST